jgi:non-specific serine/threonine protein kinase
LSERLDGLAGGRRVTPRHQTLRAAVEWSLDLLSPRQPLGFALLSVFAGGFDLRAAETVLLVEGFDRNEATDLIVELVDRSVVEPDAIGHTRRYRLLETLRHYGSGLLDKHGGDAARQARAEHYTDLAVALAALNTGPGAGHRLGAVRAGAPQRAHRHPVESRRRRHRARRSDRRSGLCVR